LLTLRTEIEKHIKKLVHPLKEEKELLALLKLKLTKKELKLLKLWSEQNTSTQIQATLHLEEERYNQLSVKLIKKLNQERMKQEICI